MHIRKASQGKKILHVVSDIFTPQVLHTKFEITFTSLHFTTHKYPSRYALIYPPSLHYSSLHFTFLHFTTLLDNF